MTNKIDIGNVIEEVKKLFNNSQDLWVIGEREWSIKLEREVLQAEKKRQKLENCKTGIFFSDNSETKIESIDYSNCVKIYFFNSKKEVFLIREPSEDTFFYYKETNFPFIEGNKDAVLHTLENLKQKSNGSNNNFRYEFAFRIGAVLEHLKDNPIKVLVDKDKKEWRFYHE